MKPSGGDASAAVGAMTRHEAFASGILGKYAPARRSSGRGLSLIFRKAERSKSPKAAATVVRAQAADAESRERHRETQRIVEKLKVLEREKIVERERVVIRQVFVVREADRIVREQRQLRERAVSSPLPATERQAADAGHGTAAIPERTQEGNRAARGDRAASEERATGSERERPANVRGEGASAAATSRLLANNGSRPGMTEEASLASGQRESSGSDRPTGDGFPTIAAPAQRLTGNAEEVSASSSGEKGAKPDGQVLPAEGGGSRDGRGGRFKSSLADAIRLRASWPMNARRKEPDMRSAGSAEAMRLGNRLQAKGRPVLRRAVFAGPLIVFRRGPGRSAKGAAASSAASERSRGFRAETEDAAGKNRTLAKPGSAAPSPPLAPYPQSMRNAPAGAGRTASLQDEEGARPASLSDSSASYGRLEPRRPTADTWDESSAGAEAQAAENKRQDVAGTANYASADSSEAGRTDREDASPPGGLKGSLQPGESASSARAQKPVELQFRREGNVDTAWAGDEEELEHGSGRTSGPSAPWDMGGLERDLPEGVPASSASTPETFPADRTSPEGALPEKGKWVRVTGPRPEGGLPSVYWLVSAERLAAVPNRVVKVPSPLRLVDRLSRQSGSIRLNVPESRRSDGMDSFGTPSPVNRKAGPATPAISSPKLPGRDPFDSRMAGNRVRPAQTAGGNELPGERKRWPRLPIVQRLNGRTPGSLRLPGRQSVSPLSDAAETDADSPAAKLPNAAFGRTGQTRDPRSRWGYLPAQVPVLAFRLPNSGSKRERTAGAVSSPRSSAGAHSGAALERLVPRKNENTTGALNGSGAGYLANGATGNEVPATGRPAGYGQPAGPQEPHADAGMPPNRLSDAGRKARGVYAAKNGASGGRYPALAQLLTGGAPLSRKLGRSLTNAADRPMARTTAALPAGGHLVRPGSAGRAGTLQASADRAQHASNMRPASMHGINRPGAARPVSIRTAAISGGSMPSAAARMASIAARSSAEPGLPSTGRPKARSGLTLDRRRPAGAGMASSPVATKLAPIGSFAQTQSPAGGGNPLRPLTARSLARSAALPERGLQAASFRLPFADGAAAGGTAIAPQSPSLAPAASRGQGALRPDAPRLAWHAPHRAPAPADLEMRRQERPAPAPEPPREIVTPEPRTVDEEQLREALSRMPELRPEKLADQVYKALMKKMKFEQRLRGY